MREAAWMLTFLYLWYAFLKDGKMETDPGKLSRKRRGTEAMEQQQEKMTDRIDELLEQPCWVVDLLPEQVPADSPGQFFAVEEYYLKPPQMAVLHRKFAEILLKLNCYFDFSLGAAAGDEWVRNPEPEMLVSALCNEKDIWTLCVYFEAENALIYINCDDICFTVYHPTERLLNLIRKLAGAEGLFVRKAGAPA